jgi:hypothetical protein
MGASCALFCLGKGDIDYMPFCGTFGIGWGSNRPGYIGKEIKFKIMLRFME